MLLITLTVGCAKIDFMGRLPWQKEKEEEPPVPTRMTAVWTNTVMNQPARPGVRGFGGRIVFYGQEQKEALAVEGTLTVYGFDDTQQQAAGRAPTKKFVFLPEHLPSHQSESLLGPSYSFWIPWDVVGGEPRTISLITRFEDQSGRVILSDPTRLVLPGLQTDEMAEDQGQQRPERPASFQTPVREEPNESSLETTTITVPKNFVAGSARGSPDMTTSEISRRSLQAQDGSQAATAPDDKDRPAGKKDEPVEPGGHRPKASARAEDSAEAPGARQSQPASGHYARPRHQAPSAPWPRPTRRPFARRPHPAGWPSGPQE